LICSTPSKFSTNTGRFFFHGATSPYSFSAKEMWPGFIDDHSSHNSLKGLSPVDKFHGICCAIPLMPLDLHSLCNFLQCLLQEE